MSVTRNAIAHGRYSVPKKDYPEPPARPNIPADIDDYTDKDIEAINNYRAQIKVYNAACKQIDIEHQNMINNRRDLFESDLCIEHGIEINHPFAQTMLRLARSRYKEYRWLYPSALCQVHDKFEEMVALYKIAVENGMSSKVY